MLENLLHGFQVSNMDQNLGFNVVTVNNEAVISWSKAFWIDIRNFWLLVFWLGSDDLWLMASVRVPGSFFLLQAGYAG